MPLIFVAAMTLTQLRWRGTKERKFALLNNFFRLSEVNELTEEEVEHFSANLSSGYVEHTVLEEGRFKSSETF